MKYELILKILAEKNNCSPKEIEEEMIKALQIAMVTATPKSFITTVSQKVKTIYHNQYIL